jgi:hypothetical protein
MALIYFPKAANLGFRDSFNPTYEQLILATNPNTVLYFDFVSGLNAATASNLFITASWALTASVTLLFSSNSLSASYAATSSFAQNAGSSTSGGGSSLSSSGFTTITTSSGNWITASFVNTDQYITISTGSIFSFTASNVPPAGTASNVSLFVNNIAAATSSLIFPVSWTFIGIVPTYLTSSKNAILSLKAFGNQIVAAWGSSY